MVVVVDQSHSAKRSRLLVEGVLRSPCDSALRRQRTKSIQPEVLKWRLGVLTALSGLVNRSQHLCTVVDEPAF
jgi:hypothetical protein